MEERIVKHKELGGDDFENFTKAKDAKIWKWLREAGQTEQAKCVTVQPFAKTSQRSKGQNTKQLKASSEGIKSVPHRTSQINQKAPRKDTFSQPSQQEPNMERKIISKRFVALAFV